MIGLPQFLPACTWNAGQTQFSIRRTASTLFFTVLFILQRSTYFEELFKA